MGSAMWAHNQISLLPEGAGSAPPQLALQEGGGICHLLLTLKNLMTKLGPSAGTNNRFHQL